MNTGVTVKCVVCGLEITGQQLPDGRIKASDRVRPAPEAKAKPGYCMQHAGGQK